MRHFASFVLFSLVGCMIMLQRDVDGSALMEGYHGLFLALLLCIAGQLWSLAGAARVVLAVEKD